MPLEAGTTFGPYRVEEAVGAGGMGEVYRARDTRLDRDVAIKILPSHLSSNVELRQRFEREAKTISSLQHPHICSLFDIGHEDGVDFLVMEYIEGQNLSALLSDGPLSNEDVLKYGLQITEALETAHKSGIVHRDLKPGNVMITKSGVKLLDFGLAKVAEAGQTTDSSLTSLPTVQPGSNEPLTTQGTILGTYQYMSPEQLEGKESDVRSDIFALGAVLYEMATGRKAFEGESQASLIASIMSTHPTPISTIHPMTPPVLDRVVKTCLEKNPEDRWQTAHDVALQLKWIAEGGSQVGLPAPVSAKRHRRERMAWIAAAVAGIAAIALGAMQFTRPAPEAPELTRFQIEAPPGINNIGSPRISPDGRYISFDGTDSTGTTMLWIRPMNDLEARPLPGTENCDRAFWSPDSRHLAFFSGPKLKRVTVSGGPPLTLCDFPTGADGSWGAGGMILMDGTTGDSINVVPEGGGIPTGATTIDRARGENTHGWPFFLPDGKHFVFVSWLDDGPAEIRLGKLGSFETTFLTAGDSRLEYMEPGYLVYESSGTLLAHPFDADARKFTGDPFPLRDDIGTGGFGLAHFSGSNNATLIYTVGESSERELVWYDREGNALESIAGSGNFANPTLSPDGNKIAFQLPNANSSGADLWIIDLARGTRSRFTFHDSNNCCPVWSPDGRRIMFSSSRDGDWDVFIRNADGTGTLTKLVDTPGALFAYAWSEDGSVVSGYNRFTETGFDVIAFDPRQEQPEMETLIETRFFDGDAAISPDGRFLAYSSFDGSQDHVYLTTYPVGGGRWQVSTSGGEMPQWRSDGKEIYYITGDGSIMSVDVSLDPEVLLSVPRRLFNTQAPMGITTRNLFYPAPDGDRFLVLSLARYERVPPITVILNWTAELARR